MSRWWGIEGSTTNGMPFSVAVHVVNGAIQEAAPIVGWAVGRRWVWFKQYARDRGWHGKPLPTLPDELVERIREWNHPDVIAGILGDAWNRSNNRE